jgi:phage/plasmid-associated DNA primase
VDASHAFFRRWIVVPFTRTLHPHEQIPRQELDARLAARRELSGVLNKALRALPNIRQRHGLLETDSMRAAWAEFMGITDPVAIWLEESTVADPDAFVAKRALLAAYNASAERVGRTMTATGFGRALTRLRPGLEDGQRTIGGRIEWVWLGLKLRH